MRTLEYVQPNMSSSFQQTIIYFGRFSCVLNPAKEIQNTNLNIYLSNVSIGLDKWRLVAISFSFIYLHTKCARFFYLYQTGIIIIICVFEIWRSPCVCVCVCVFMCVCGIIYVNNVSCKSGRTVCRPFDWCVSMCKGLGNRVVRKYRFAGRQVN